jgi:hypothetical protein
MRRRISSGVACARNIINTQHATDFATDNGEHATGNMQQSTDDMQRTKMRHYTMRCETWCTCNGKELHATDEY